MTVSMNLESLEALLWVSSEQEPDYLGSIIGAYDLLETPISFSGIVEVYDTIAVLRVWDHIVGDL